MVLMPRVEGHMIDVAAYKRATYPPPLKPPGAHLSDEDIAAQLDKSEKRSRAARKASVTRKKASKA